MGNFLDEGPVSLIGRLGRIERFQRDDLFLKRANRFGFELDAVDRQAPLEVVLAAISGEGSGASLAALKILTTLRKFRKLSGRDRIDEGDWFFLELEPRNKRRGPLAWAASLGERGYEATRPFVVRSITWLFADGDTPLRSLSAAVAADRKFAQTVAAACDFPTNAIGRLSDVKALLRAQSAPHDVIVRDVGQASLVSLRNKQQRSELSLDAGWPISWNRKTAPKSPPSLRAASTAMPVILSHWDWDHLHGFYAVPGLSDGVWIAPVQKLGPGPKRVAALIAKADRLYGVGTRKLVAGPFVLGRCKGKPGNSNNTGLAVRVTLASGKQVLFVGDADYEVLPSGLLGPADFLVVTHHGAEFKGPVISAPVKDAPAVVSVGAGNGYGHPSSDAVAAHENAQWALSYTCKTTGQKRGGRALGP